MFKYTDKKQLLTLHIYSKVPICTALYNAQLTSKALRYGKYHAVLPATHTLISTIQRKTFIKDTVRLTT